MAFSRECVREIAKEPFLEAASSIGKIATRIGQDPYVRPVRENREEENAGSLFLEIYQSFCNPVFMSLVRVGQVNLLHLSFSKVKP